MTYAGIGLAVYFVAVLLLAVRKPVEVQSRWLQLLRFLLPSWRFFDELGQLPVLSMREGEGPWRPVLPPMTRSVRRLVLNADGNFALACESLVQQLVADVVESDDVTALESYRLVSNLVAMRATATRFQWRVELEEDGVRQEAIVSPVLER